MSQENELIRLENFVSKLLQSFREQKEENNRLISELQDRETTIDSLREQLTTSDMERSEIGSRVSRIIEKIEDWEATTGEDVELNATPSADLSHHENIFSVGVVEESREDE